MQNVMVHMGVTAAHGSSVNAGECMEAVSSELTFFTLPNCFELFGFDLLVDECWNVWLLEVSRCIMHQQHLIGNQSLLANPSIDCLVATGSSAVRTTHDRLLSCS